MVLQYLSNAGDEGAKRDSIYEYLKDVLPANKTEEQQLRYVGRLLVELNEEKQIDRILHAIEGEKELQLYAIKVVKCELTK